MRSTPCILTLSIFTQPAELSASSSFKHDCSCDHCDGSNSHDVHDGDDDKDAPDAVGSDADGKDEENEAYHARGPCSQVAVVGLSSSGSSVACEDAFKRCSFCMFAHPLGARNALFITSGGENKDP